VDPTGGSPHTYQRALASVVRSMARQDGASETIGYSPSGFINPLHQSQPVTFRLSALPGRFFSFAPRLLSARPVRRLAVCRSPSRRPLPPQLAGSQPPSGSLQPPSPQSLLRPPLSAPRSLQPPLRRLALIAACCSRSPASSAADSFPARRLPPRRRCRLSRSPATRLLCHRPRLPLPALPRPECLRRPPPSRYRARPSWGQEHGRRPEESYLGAARPSCAPRPSKVGVGGWYGRRGGVEEAL